MDKSTRIGFLGVGLMGHGAAKNILERGGYPLTVLGHRNREPVDDLIARGAREAADPAALAEASDVVITCVPSSAEVEAAFHGPRGLLAGARPGMIFIDATTADPSSTRKIGAELAAIGCHLVDAALGRTPREAEAGKLSTYVGGDPEIIEKIRPILSSYADTIVRLRLARRRHHLQARQQFDQHRHDHASSPRDSPPPPSSASISMRSPTCFPPAASTGACGR